MMGYAPNEVTPSLRAWWQQIHSEDRDRAIEAFERAKDERREYSCEYRVVRPDGTIATPMRAASSTTIGKGEPFAPMASSWT